MSGSGFARKRPGGILRLHADALGAVRGAEHVWRGRPVAPALGAVVGRAFRRPGLGRGPPQPAEPAPHTLLIRARAVSALT